ncbi:hypothetical protein D3C78_939550 [compost metagenome]
MAGTHHRHAHLAHHGAHVGEVDVHQAGALHDVGDAAHGTGQHVVGLGEGGQQAGVLAEDGQQLLVGDGDQRVDMLGQGADALVGNLHAPASLEGERTGDHRHGEDAHFLGHLGDDRRRTGAGAAAHAGGDEHHVGALQHLGDALAVLQRGLAADVGIGAGTEPLGHVHAQLQDGLGIDLLQCLGIGVGTDEIDVVDVAAQHVIDGVAATTADTDDLDYRIRLNVID